jgi:2Fe-2S ferredoxin
MTDPVLVTFLPMEFSAEAEPGDTILEAALKNGVPLAHDCGGNCACTTCHVRVVSGTEHLSPMEEVEDDRLSTAPQREKESRLACQALLKCGPVTVVIPEDDLWDEIAEECIDSEAVGAYNRNTKVGSVP